MNSTKESMEKKQSGCERVFGNFEENVLKKTKYKHNQKNNTIKGERFLKMKTLPYSPKRTIRG